MKVVATIDTDGHFHVFNIENRKAIFEFIKEDLYDGDAWANRDDYDDNLNYMILSYNEWIEFINTFAQRGDLEIIEA